MFTPARQYVLSQPTLPSLGFVQRSLKSVVGFKRRPGSPELRRSLSKKRRKELGDEEDEESGEEGPGRGAG